MALAARLLRTFARPPGTHSPRDGREESQELVELVIHEVAENNDQNKCFRLSDCLRMFQVFWSDIEMVCTAIHVDILQTNFARPHQKQVFAQLFWHITDRFLGARTCRALKMLPNRA